MILRCLWGIEAYIYVTNLGGNMARFTQFPIMITWSTIIYEIMGERIAAESKHMRLIRFQYVIRVVQDPHGQV